MPKPVLHGLWTVLLIASLAGCVSTEISTHKDASYQDKLTRVLVYSEVQHRMRDDFGKGFARLFEGELSTRLAARGIQVLVISVDELGLDPSVYARRMAEFAPRSVLSILPLGGERKEEGGYITQRFDITVGPPAPALPRVWRAAVTIHGGDASAKTKAVKLAGDILAKLLEDGLL